MIKLVLSIFDAVYGPQVFLKVPNSDANSFPVDHIPILMDVYNEGFFLHKFGELKTANYIFTIFSPLARGEKEILMISLISFQEEFYSIDLSSFRLVLEYFTQELADNLDHYKAFHKSGYSDGPKIYDKISELMSTFYNSIIERFSHHFQEKIVYELTNEGKKMIINDLKVRFVKLKNNIKKEALTTQAGSN